MGKSYDANFERGKYFTPIAWGKKKEKKENKRWNLWTKRQKGYLMPDYQNVFGQKVAFY